MVIENVIGNQFSEGLAAVQKDGKWGYIDTKGRLVIDYQFDSAAYFSEGLAFVEKNNKGYIDTNGKMVINLEKTTGYAFTNGVAYVMTSLDDWGYINTAGNIFGE